MQAWSIANVTLLQQPALGRRKGGEQHFDYNRWRLRNSQALFVPPPPFLLQK